MILEAHSSTELHLGTCPLIIMTMGPSIAALIPHTVASNLLLQ